MSKRPAVDLLSLTSDQASPMPEAAQRTTRPVEPDRGKSGATATANLEGLAFKVPPAFRRRFRQHAAAADLKLNELLFEALDAWERAQGLEIKNS